jgi:hypothetical protein
MVGTRAAVRTVGDCGQWNGKARRAGMTFRRWIVQAVAATCSVALLALLFAAPVGLLHDLVTGWVWDQAA